MRERPGAAGAFGSQKRRLYRASTSRSLKLHRSATRLSTTGRYNLLESWPARIKQDAFERTRCARLQPSPCVNRHKNRCLDPAPRHHLGTIVDCGIQQFAEARLSVTVLPCHCSTPLIVILLAGRIGRVSLAAQRFASRGIRWPGHRFKLFSRPVLQATRDKRTFAPMAHCPSPVQERAEQPPKTRSPGSLPKCGKGRPVGRPF